MTYNEFFNSARMRQLLEDIPSLEMQMDDSYARCQKTYWIRSSAAVGQESW